MSNLDIMFPVGYAKVIKYTLHNTQPYGKWFDGLKDHSVKIKILARLARVENGNFGDCRQLGDNLFELRFFFGGGLRIYYTIRAEEVVLLLAGGNKSTQASDIDKATKLLGELED